MDIHRCLFVTLGDRHRPGNQRLLILESLATLPLLSLVPLTITLLPTTRSVLVPSVIFFIGCRGPTIILFDYRHRPFLTVKLLSSAAVISPFYYLAATLAITASRLRPGKFALILICQYPFADPDLLSHYYPDIESPQRMRRLPTIKNYSNYYRQRKCFYFSYFSNL